MLKATNIEELNSNEIECVAGGPLNFVVKAIIYAVATGGVAGGSYAAGQAAGGVIANVDGK